MELARFGGAGGPRNPARAKLAFRSVNRQNRPGYQPGLQRHHLLPCQLLGQRSLGRLFGAIGTEQVGFDDFRANGLLLPCQDKAVIRLGLPLHRGPHRAYNAMVGERVGQIEADWSGLRLRSPEIALECAVMRLRLLQRALHRRLLADANRLQLNRLDPLGRNEDFTELDALAEQLWGASEPDPASIG